MDDAKRFGLLILNAIGLGLFRVTALLAIGAAAHSARAEVDYVSPAEITTLRAQFDSAKLDDATVVTRHAWLCDMYGVRSKLQVQRAQKLYAFRADDLVHGFVNSGDEPISDYRIENDALEGHGEKDVVDQVRVMKDGRLISKLSVPSRGITVAYAVCTGS